MSDTSNPAFPSPTPPEPRPASAEFIPTDAEMVPSALPRITGPDAWLARNIRPLIFICLALVLEGMTGLAALNIGRPEPLETPTPSVEASPVPELDEAEILRRFENSPVAWIQLSIVAIGFIASIVLAIMWLASSAEQRWIRSLLMDFPVRPQPALRGIDLLAMIFIFLALSHSVGTAVVLSSNGDLDGSTRMVLNLLIMAIVGSVVIAIGVHLARRRGGGAHGSHGVWPFWNVSPLNAARTIAQDVGLGIAAYVMTAWMLIVAILVNTRIVEFFGQKPDQHDLVRIIAERPDPAVLFVIGLSATLGAAFFEELFFRGMLYNVLRRHLGGVAGALAAGFLFSIAHGIWAQVLGLWFLGMVMTWLYDRTGRLIASMTFHFMNNFVALLAMILSSQNPPST